MVFIGMEFNKGGTLICSFSVEPLKEPCLYKAVWSVLFLSVLNKVPLLSFLFKDPVVPSLTIGSAYFKGISVESI